MSHRLLKHQQSTVGSVTPHSWGLALVALGLGACASPLAITTAAKDLVMGDRICRGEATQIYFANQDDVLSPSAVQVLSVLSTSLLRCPRRKILLLAVSGDDGAPAFTNVAKQRLYRVRSTLLERGLSEGSFDAEPTLAPHVSLPKGPIGGVVVVTRR